MEITWGKVAADPTLAPKLLRLLYHDCFVRGCDASILLDSVEGSLAEKEAILNKDAVSYLTKYLRFYQESIWEVFTGRKVGKISNGTEDLPSASENHTTLQQQFASNGLNVSDLVALAGAHPIGVARCLVFARRLFNFTGRGDTDPSLDPEYARDLKTKCSNPPNNPATTAVDLDRNISLHFDSHYFVALNRNQGLLRSDAALLTDPHAASIVRVFRNFYVFMAHFRHSIKKMSDIGVITEDGVGEIRKNCRKVNA
ncbi:hypothetical protein FNV43_RR01950 [Rhamnella rubrinervis]|uniref:peroxidase n=1 Tax=Rhamnella rubrinervis TaxID=2594499 RepID=A0A8K0HSD0_9ROSA|nr:hypothetical protein FNV43_RR01950 [Rhamnella rubrinervis]